MLPEGLGHLEAVQYLVNLNPIDAQCCVQLILLFYRTKNFLEDELQLQWRIIHLH